MFLSKYFVTNDQQALKKHFIYSKIVCVNEKFVPFFINLIKGLGMQDYKNVSFAC